MTMLAATVSASGAVLSQDSWMVAPTAEYQRNAARAAGITRDASQCGEAFGHASDPNAVTIVGHGLKIIPVPRFNLAIATTGAFQLGLAWALELMHPAILSLDHLRREGADRLAQVRRQIAPDAEVAIVHAGFDPSRGEGFGFVLSSDGPRQDIAIGETIGLAPDQQDPEYASIAALWQTAAKGFQIEQLHRALFEQQKRAFWAGKMGPGVAVGGSLHHVEVSSSGIAISTAPPRTAADVAA